MDDSLDALVAARHVEEIGSMSLVTVPGWSLLSEAQKRRVAAKVEENQIETPLDVGAVDDALKSLQSGPLAPPTEPDIPPEYNTDEDFPTPPPMSEEESIKESRVLEAKAREELENEGCPPCYPANLEVPLRNPPEEYRGIISYWHDETHWDTVLCAQRYDWEGFRGLQTIRHYRWRHFNTDFEDDIRRRRHKYGVQGDIHLQLKLRLQTRLQNWVEYQDHHFREHEKIEEEIVDLRKWLEDEPYLQGRLEYTERRRERHNILLEWIEQQRIAMEAQSPPFMRGDDHGHPLEPVRRPSDSGRGKRQVRSRAVLREAGVSKPKRQRHRSKGSQRKALDAVPGTRHSSLPQTDILLGQEGRPNKPRYAKEAALRRIRTRPQKVSKARAIAKTPLVTQLQRATERAQPGCRQFPQRSQSVPEVKTRSGRVSRKPVRWVPGGW
ncbi:MAG: hypothetical protein M1816_004147 [Peltula sp. TS41687]|nr:MAG: hypothetical protein M1816_004147 [Peltula sp. TS41687]